MNHNVTLLKRTCSITCSDALLLGLSHALSVLALSTLLLRSIDSNHVNLTVKVDMLHRVSKRSTPEILSHAFSHAFRTCTSHSSASIGLSRVRHITAKSPLLDNVSGWSAPRPFSCLFNICNSNFKLCRLIELMQVEVCICQVFHVFYCILLALHLRSLTVLPHSLLAFS